MFSSGMVQRVIERRDRMTRCCWPQFVMTHETCSTWSILPIFERDISGGGTAKCSNHCGLVTPYGDRDLGQHWLRCWLVAWWHQAITWTTVDWSSVKSSDIHIRAISQEMPQPSVTKICLKITFLKFHSNFPGGQWVFRTHPHGWGWPQL